MQASYSGNKGIRAGKVVQHTRDGDQKVQALDWVLIDIFPPFRAEYYDGLAFGSLWQEWLLKLKAASGELKRSIICGQRVMLDPKLNFIVY